MNVNVEPLPEGLFSAHKRPLCPLIISLQIASPSPVHPAPVFVLLLWINLSKTDSSSDSGMPMPLSSIENDTAGIIGVPEDSPAGLSSLSCILITIDSPSGLNFMALEMTFIITCWILSGSRVTLGF
jgi:hypothetical protein